MKNQLANGGRCQYQNYSNRPISNPEVRRVREEQAAKKHLWLELAKAHEAAGLTQAEWVQRKP